jgi:hypothetical protein
MIKDIYGASHKNYKLHAFCQLMWSIAVEMGRLETLAINKSLWRLHYNEVQK